MFKKLVLCAALGASAHLLAQAPNPAVIGKPATGAVTQDFAQKLGITVQCPATVTVQATNAPSPWLPNSVLLNVDSVTLTNQPVDIQQMVCRYRGSGYEWAIMHPIRPTYKSCVANGKSSFTCVKL